MQPRIMPRPDIAGLGIKYRRIPILSIGRDVYFDTRLILKKLQQLAPERPFRAHDSSPEHRALEELLQTIALDSGLARNVVMILSAKSPMMKDAAFVKDRADLVGSSFTFTAETAAALRPDAVMEVKKVLRLLESTLLADGRTWLLNGESPSLADIELWPLHWMFTATWALPPDQISAEIYPKVFAWTERFQKAMSNAVAALPAP